MELDRRVGLKGMLDESTFLGYAPGHGPSQPQVAAGQRRVWNGPSGRKFTVLDQRGERWGIKFDDNGDTGHSYRELDILKTSSLVGDAPATPAPATPPSYNIAAGAGAELHDHGHPRTALEAIQARKKPEPWRPSVDDFDLLPDVDVRR